MSWVLEAGLVGEGDGIKPVEDLHALTEASLAPLRGMVVRVDEAGDEKLARGQLVDIYEVGFDIHHVLHERDDLMRTGVPLKSLDGSI